WCFAPYRLARMDFTVGEGGGLWCSRPGSQILRMRRTPAPVTQVESTGAVHRIGGAMRVTIGPRGGEHWAVALRGGWRLDANVAKNLRGIDLALSLPGRPAVGSFVSRA